jgi:hypothetical protein
MKNFYWLPFTPPLFGSPYRSFTLLYLFFPFADCWVPLVSLPFPLPFFSLPSAQPDPAPPQSSPRPAAPSTFPFSLGKPIKAITLPIKSPSVTCRFPSLIAQLCRIGRRPSMASAAAAGFLCLPSPSSPCSYLSSSSSSCSPLCTRNTPLHALEHPFPPKHRRLCISPPPDVVGEVHRRPIFSFPERDRIPHMTLVVQGKSPPGSHSDWSLGPRPPERRPSRCRRRTPSLPPSLRP